MLHSCLGTNISSSSPLDHLKLLDSALGVGVPDYRGILNQGADKWVVTGLIHVMRTVIGVTL